MQNDELLSDVTEVAGSKVLPPCVILGKIGQGGMGAVYRARHLNLDIDVAVKVLRPQLVADDPLFVQRFRREGQSAAKISHQNVIRVYDVAESAGLHYIVMELVVGESARQRVERKGPLAVGEALQLMHDAAAGLGEAHRLGFVHRDIKPDNLLVSHQGQVKVADMGLAKPTLRNAGQSTLSSPNQIMGTPSYMPPEQWESTNVTAAADVWALGATMYFLLTGEDAITDPERIPARIMRKILLQPFPDVRELRPDVPAEVAAVLAKATAKEPGQRYLDAGELATAIAALPLRRLPLRDASAGTTAAQTLLSPPPLKNLEQIKQWLREDFLTRSPTPSGLKKERDTGSFGGPAGITPDVLPDRTVVTSSPSRGTGTTPLPAPGRGRNALIAGVGVGAVAVVWWALRANPPIETPPTPNPVVNQTTTPPQPQTDPKPPAPTPNATDPPAVVDQKPLPAPTAAERAEKAADEARDLAAQQRWAQALAAMVAARTLAPDDTTLTRRQQLLREQVRAAAAEAVRAQAPGDQLAPGALLTFRLAPGDGVQALRLGDTTALRAADGAFAASVAATGAELTVRATLTDGTEVELARWPLRYVEPKPPDPQPVVTPPVEPKVEPKVVPKVDPQLDPSMRSLAFAVTPEAADGRVEGYAVTTTDEIVVRGRVIPADGVEFTCNGKRIEPTATADGFELRLPVPIEGEPQDLRLVATRADRQPATAIVPNVVKLTRSPAFAVLEPGFESSTESLSARVRVGRVDRWVRRAFVVRNGVTYELVRDVNEPEPVWIGEVPLDRGRNTLDIKVENLAKATNKRVSTVDCTIQPASVRSVTLTANGATRLLPRGERCFVAADAAKLVATAGGSAPQLLVDDRPLASGDAIELTGLREGEVRRVEVRATNKLGNSDPFVVEIVRDTTAPAVTLTSPGPDQKVPTTKPLVLEGKCSDPSGIASVLTAEGAVARVDEKAGTWTLALPAQKASFTVKLKVRDRAGNEAAPEFAITVE